ncbi:MAG: inner membrane protein [Parcubacteria group bacterium Gr01-1014_48]|nr:MAG: inner membrane protein [Parcubacteria group bacterium Greene0416_14]TSC71384.1 MAG: inner membrane protein [Parcubacteria group bacterium Gr01-1014_48]
MITMLFVWIGIFIASLFGLVKGSEWVMRGAERIGIHFGLSRFTIGVLIVGVGTSLPEFASGIASLLHGTSEIATANVIGSNIFNILVIIGVSAIIGKKLVVTKDLMDSELPIFIVATLIFLGVAYDGKIIFIESLLLFAAYLVYLLHTLRDKDEESPVVAEIKSDIKSLKPKLTSGVLVAFFLGLAGLLAGAKYLVDAVLSISGSFGVAPEILTLLAVAAGTSIPELMMSLRALKEGKSDIAIGNVFGSNAFNLLMVLGLPGLFSTLSLSPISYTIGLPTLAAATFIFLIFGISKKVYSWEGYMLLLLFVFFALQVLGLV